jgi:hypothetical protein
VRLRTALHEFLADDDGTLSMGRLIALIGTLIGVELVQFGLGLAVYEIAAPRATATGLALVGIGAGFFTGGAALKFGSKNIEARMASQIQARAPEIPATPALPAGAGSGDAHV